MTTRPFKIFSRWSARSTRITSRHLRSHCVPKIPRTLSNKVCPCRCVCVCVCGRMPTPTLIVEGLKTTKLIRPTQRITVNSRLIGIKALRSQWSWKEGERKHFLTPAGLVGEGGGGGRSWIDKSLATGCPPVFGRRGMKGGKIMYFLKRPAIHRLAFFPRRRGSLAPEAPPPPSPQHSEERRSCSAARSAFSWRVQTRRAVIRSSSHAHWRWCNGFHLAVILLVDDLLYS